MYIGNTSICKLPNTLLRHKKAFSFLSRVLTKTVAMDKYLTASYTKNTLLLHKRCYTTSLFLTKTVKMDKYLVANCQTRYYVIKVLHNISAHNSGNTLMNRKGAELHNKRCQILIDTFKYSLTLSCNLMK